MAGSKFKPQFRRLLFIDRKIREGRYPNCTTLAQEWEVTPKTIQRDIDYLKWELDAPIVYDRSRRGLCYSNPAWFLPSVMLSEGDILALLIGTQALNMYEGTPVAGTLRAIYQKLAAALPEQVSIAPELIFSRFSFISPPSRPIREETWKLLIRGVLHQRVTEIEYDSPRSTAPKRHTIHPLHLANIEGEWYLLAHEVRWKDIAQFAVSRIAKVELQQAGFVPPRGFDAAKMLAERFGKYIHADGGRKTAVRLLFSRPLAGYVAEKTWHAKQKVQRRRDGRVELRFPAFGLRDLVPWILGFGGDVRVLAPRELEEACRIAARRGISKVFNNWQEQVCR